MLDYPSYNGYDVELVPQEEDEKLKKSLPLDVRYRVEWVNDQGVKRESCRFDQSKLGNLVKIASKYTGLPESQIPIMVEEWWGAEQGWVEIETLLWGEI